MQSMKTFYQDGEMYAQFFLFNNDMNNAGDPINFKIYPENNERIAKSFIGRPYLLPQKDADGKWINKHFREDNLDTLFIKQKKFAAGEIVSTHQNRSTGNYNAVVKVFPEHYDTFKKGKIPPATSPMLAHSDSFMDEDGKLHIKDGIGVHLQGVLQGGYPPELSEIKSICEGGMNECMTELQTVAAAGELLEYQESEHFSKEEIAESDTMSQQQQAPPGAAPPGADAGAQQGDQRIAALEQGLAELTKQFQMILQKLGGAPQQAPPAAPPGMAGAAGETVTEEPEAMKEMRTELESIKAQREVEMKALADEKLSLFLKDRNRTATEIVETKLKLHKLSPESRDSEIKKLVEMKSGENYIDLSLLHAELTDSLKSFVGAAGATQVYEYGPELGADTTNDATTDYHSVMESI